MAVTFKGAHFPQDIIRTSVRWYVAYPLSYRHVGLDHGIGHLACTCSQKNERLTPSKG